jgi:fatty-acyl-CoA synthase
MDDAAGAEALLPAPHRLELALAAHKKPDAGKAGRMAEFTFAPLTPASFLDRSAAVFADRVAVIDGERTFTYREMSGRCRRLTGALAAMGVGHEDRVAALCTNSHVMLELHHAVPMRGAALVSVNIRLSPAEMAQIIRHSGASLLVATHEFADLGGRLATELDLPLVIAGGSGDEYEAWLAGADPAGALAGEIDERQLLAINYTSGTTGRPKGVMYHHRGAYLQATAMAYHARLGPGARYLWTLPMFHCDGWCFTWAVTAAGGTHVCLRAVKTAEIWRLLREEGITHFSAAPTVLTMIAEDPAAGVLDHEVRVQTGGAPPSAALLARMGAMNIAVTVRPDRDLRPARDQRVAAGVGQPRSGGTGQAGRPPGSAQHHRPAAARPRRRRPGRARRRRGDRRDRGQRQRRHARLLP